MRVPHRIFALALALTGAQVAAASAQTLLQAPDLVVDNPNNCAALTEILDGAESGGQWLLGDVDLYDQSVSQTPMRTVRNAFTPVACFAADSVRRAGVAEDVELVFVANLAENVCGWVARDTLLSINSRTATNISRKRRDLVCETPRAMEFSDFCAGLGADAGDIVEACIGIPRGLRAKGVLTGSTAAEDIERSQFFSAPTGGLARDTKPFFSVLEIHDVQPGDDDAIMALVGDGEGDLFGWIDLEQIKLWPTRMGLFYDPEGRGVMFPSMGELLQNWRTGAPPPQITSSLSDLALQTYIHGNLPLLSYPILRTIDTTKDGSFNTDDTSFHEVIFLGQTGEGSASRLMAQAQIAKRVEDLQRLNVMLVVDTTESMRRYLPLIRDGLVNFITSYNSRATNPANRLPTLRLGVVAYSDFASADATGFGDPIVTEVLLRPTGVGRGYNPGGQLNKVAQHPGLDDPVGLREEAALEAVAQFSDEFETQAGWFRDGPRVIIHIADHGSRSTASVAETLDILKRNTTIYYPVAVVTDDQGDASRTRGRQAFMDQAVAMLSKILSNDAPPSPDDVSRIDLADFENSTADTVKAALNLAMVEVVNVVRDLRREITGRESDLDRVSLQAQDLAASRVTIDEELRTQFGLDDISDQVIVRASSGFAPLNVKRGGLSTPVDWTYTIALEPDLARDVRINVEQLCAVVGQPEQRKAFRTLIVQLAEAFAGEKIDSNEDVEAVLSDLRTLPGAENSFLSQPTTSLLARADSTDPAVIEDLKKDVCWISYHLGNMQSRIYAQPDQLTWTGAGYSLKPGREVTKRDYRFKPLIGKEVVYLPSFFFVLPTQVEESLPGEEECRFFCD